MAPIKPIIRSVRIANRNRRLNPAEDLELESDIEDDATSSNPTSKQAVNVENNSLQEVVDTEHNSNVDNLLMFNEEIESNANDNNRIDSISEVNDLLGIVNESSARVVPNDIADSESILKDSSLRDVVIQAMCKSAQEEIENTLQAQREEFRKELALLKENNNIENKVANALLNLVGSSSNVLGADNSRVSRSNHRTQAHVKSRDLQIPKYAGAHEQKTPYDFLIEIEKYRQAIGYSHSQILSLVIPLALVEEAYRWYMFVKEDLKEWLDFESLFRKEFQPVGYIDDLRKELEERTQGSHEPLTHFIRVVNDFYERLDPTAPENVRVNRIIKQMHPEYRHKIMSSGQLFYSLKQLTDEAYKAQTSICIDREYKEPKLFSTIEPSLAYKLPNSHNMSHSGRIQLSEVAHVDSTYRPLPNREVHVSSFNRFRHFHEVQYPGHKNNPRHSFVSQDKVQVRNNWNSNSNNCRQSQDFQRVENFNQAHIPIRPFVPIISKSENSTNVQSHPSQDVRFKVSQSPNLQRNCFFCNQPGHFIRDCPVKISQVSGNGTIPGRS